jgi:excisionase family DNA binding protein
MESYTVTEAAKLLKLHPKTVRRKIRDGELGSTRIGRQYRITQAHIDAFFGGPVRAAGPPPRQRRVLASCVIDIDAISPEESSRISNTTMAALGGERLGARVDCIYYEDVGKLKIVVHGDLPATQDLLVLLSHLVEPEKTDD